MGAYVLLNLLNELRKMLFRNEFDKFNKTRARMLDFIYHMTLKLLKNRIFGVKTSRFCHLLRKVIMDVITASFEICKSLVVYRFYCMPDETACDKVTIYMYMTQPTT